MGKSKKDTLVVIGSRVSPVQPGKTGKRGPEENSVSKPSKKAKLIEKDSRKNPDDVHKTKLKPKKALPAKVKPAVETDSSDASKSKKMDNVKHVKKPSIAVAKKQESSSDSSSDSEDEPVKAQAKGASKPVALVTGPKYGKRASVPQESSSEDESSSEEEPPKTYVKAQPIHKPKAKEDSTSKDDSSSEDSFIKKGESVKLIDSSQEKEFLRVLLLQVEGVLWQYGELVSRRKYDLAMDPLLTPINDDELLQFMARITPEQQARMTSILRLSLSQSSSRRSKSTNSDASVPQRIGQNMFVNGSTEHGSHQPPCLESTTHLVGSSHPFPRIAPTLPEVARHVSRNRMSPIYQGPCLEVSSHNGSEPQDYPTDPPHNLQDLPFDPPHSTDDHAIYDLPLNPLHSHDVPGTLDPSSEPPLGASLPRITSSNIPPGCSYAINPDGSIKAGECGKRVLHRMRELCQQIFRHEMFGFDWRKIDKSKKECVIAHLHEEFPVSSLACRFSDQWMIDKMGRYIKHRRAEARKAYGKGKRRPTWVAKEDWKKLKEEFEKQPEKWKQQKNAARARLEANIISHLGSGGWTSFEEDFFEYTGRAPTDLEREDAIKHGIKQLLARLNACDGQEAFNKP